MTRILPFGRADRAPMAAPTPAAPPPTTITSYIESISSHDMETLPTLDPRSKTSVRCCSFYCRIQAYRIRTSAPRPHNAPRFGGVSSDFQSKHWDELGDSGKSRLLIARHGSPGAIPKGSARRAGLRELRKRPAVVCGDSGVTKITRFWASTSGPHPVSPSSPHPAPPGISTFP